jgi:hypothetical protein
VKGYDGWPAGPAPYLDNYFILAGGSKRRLVATRSINVASSSLARELPFDAGHRCSTSLAVGLSIAGAALNRAAGMRDAGIVDQDGDGAEYARSATGIALAALELGMLRDQLPGAAIEVVHDGLTLSLKAEPGLPLLVCADPANRRQTGQNARSFSPPQRATPFR